MSTAYPGGLDSFNDPTGSNALSDPPVKHSAQHANLNDAMAAVQGELGVNPSGTFPTVAAAISNAGIATLITGAGATQTALDARIKSTATPMRRDMTWSAGVINDGVTPVSLAIAAALSGATTRAYFPPGTYNIDQIITINLTAGQLLDIQAHQDAVFRLANGARSWMFNVIGDGTTTFRWSGGVIDGNDVNQGNEAADGNAFDVSKGIRVVNHLYAEVGNLQIGHVRGHAVNHWNNATFHAHDIVVNQDISQLAPVGGRRRDGVTGCSNVQVIERISGFTSDDMVAVISGANWGGTGTTPITTVNSVTIRDVFGGTKLDTDGVTVRRTWHGAVVAHMLGSTVREINIGNIRGDFATGAVKVGGYTTDYYGTAQTVSINGVSGTTDPSSNDGLINVGGSSLGGLCTVNSLDISNVSHTADANRSIPTIQFPYVTMAFANISNVATTVTYDLIFRAVQEIGTGTVKNINLTNVSVFNTANPVTATYAYEKATTDVTDVTVLRGSNIQAGNPGTPNVNLFTGVQCALFGIGLIPVHSDGWYRMVTMAGSHFTDQNCGVVRCDGTAWTTTSPRTLTWDTTNYGRPTAGRWALGMRVNVVGTLQNEITGWVCIGAGLGTAATWAPVNAGLNAYSYVSAAWLPTATNVTPGAEWSTEVSTAQATADGWPGAVPGRLTTIIGQGTLLYSYQTYRNRSDGAAAMLVRGFTGTAWSAWKTVTTA